MRRYAKPVHLLLVLVITALLGVHPSASMANKIPTDPTSFSQRFLTTENNTQDTSVAVDSSGGIHVGFSGHTATDGIYPAYYAYCASNCANSSSWNITILGDVGLAGGEARLELDPGGRPRMLWYQETSLSSDGVYQYAECDHDCTLASNWSVLSLTVDAVGPNMTRYFALNPQGMPRYLYTDTETGHRGTFYVYCDANCTDILNWREAGITSDYLLYDFSLAYTAQGKLQVAFRNATGVTDTLVYAACDSGCDNWANWQFSTILDKYDSSSDFSMRLDSQGRPRLAYYTGYLGSGDPLNNLLFYAWCDSNCLQTSSWQTQATGLPANVGKEVDLALDSQDHPQLAYYIEDYTSSIYGLGYMACTSNCETNHPTWEAQIIETSDDLNATAPVPPESGCVSSWLDVGRHPSLAVDADGQPRVGYTAFHYQGVTCSIHEDMRLARIALSGSGTVPPDGSGTLIYLPIAKKPRK